jgi:hypothetical protein
VILLGSSGNCKFGNAGLWVLSLVGAAALAVAAAAAASPGGYAFGREGGNILPFTVTVAPDGAVTASGPAKVGRARLTPAQLAKIAGARQTARFATLPSSTLCPGTLPDIAGTWIRAGGRTVHVHGTCSQRFTRVWNALAAAVRLSYG